MKSAIIIVFLAACIIAACNDEKSVTPQPIRVDYFPNKVGTWWVYETYDSVRNTCDTLTISIVDTLTLPGMDSPSALWLSEPNLSRWYGYTHDSLYMVDCSDFDDSNSVDSVIAYWWREGWDPWMKYFYIVPFEIGDYWTVGFPSWPESTTVESTATVLTPKGVFAETYEIKNLYSCGDECGGWYTYWFKEGIGIVKSYRIEHDIFDYPDGPQMITTWNLIDYHIEE
jgi:hypothetical protein